VSWTHLVQDGVYWQDLVNTVSKMRGISSPAEEFYASQKGLHHGVSFRNMLTHVALRMTRIQGSELS